MKTLSDTMRVLVLVLLLVGGIFGADIFCEILLPEVKFLRYKIKSNQLPTPFQQEYEYCQVTKVSGTVSFPDEPISVNATQAFLYDDIVEIVFFGPFQNFRFIPRKVFEKFPNLASFTIKSINFTEITTNAFNNCSKLKFLGIADSFFPILSAGFAETCENLSFLEFSSNTVGTIHVDAFRGLKNLRELAIAKVDYLNPLMFIHTPKLESMSMECSSRIKTIQPDLFSTVTLKDFWLYDSKIESLSALEFKNSSALFIIALGLNQITEIDPEFLKIFPGDREEFQLNLTGNNCTDYYYTKQEELYMLQPCIDNWIKSHSTTTATATSATAEVSEARDD
jgi:hypothetical protein